MTQIRKHVKTSANILLGPSVFYLVLNTGKKNYIYIYSGRPMSHLIHLIAMVSLVLAQMMEVNETQVTVNYHIKLL